MRGWCSEISGDVSVVSSSVGSKRKGHQERRLLVQKLLLPESLIFVKNCAMHVGVSPCLLGNWGKLFFYPAFNAFRSC